MTADWSPTPDPVTGRPCPVGIAPASRHHTVQTRPVKTSHRQASSQRSSDCAHPAPDRSPTGSPPRGVNGSRARARMADAGAARSPGDWRSTPGAAGTRPPTPVPRATGTGSCCRTCSTADLNPPSTSVPACVGRARGGQPRPACSGTGRDSCPSRGHPPATRPAGSSGYAAAAQPADSHQSPDPAADPRLRAPCHPVPLRVPGWRAGSRAPMAPGGAVRGRGSPGCRSAVFKAVRRDVVGPALHDRTTRLDERGARIHR